jgi:hypothetical protein
MDLRWWETAYPTGSFAYRHAAWTEAAWLADVLRLRRFWDAAGPEQYFGCAL